MKCSHFLLVVCIAALSLCGRVDAQDSSSTKDLAAQVRSIFLAKCSECHGRSLSRPRAGLYLSDLGQVASNPEWVVPFEPEKSYLWTLIRDDDMPAKGAKAGPLNAKEKDIVRAWIAAGAPVPPSPSSSGAPVLPSPSTSTPLTSAPETEDSFLPPTAPASPFTATSVLAWLGRFHILVIHFPIALLATAAFLEIIAAWRGNRMPEATVRICVLLGAASSVAAVALGWLHADVGGFGNISGGILTLHRWLGTAVGLWSIGIVLLSERDSRCYQRSSMFRVLLWLGAFLVAITAHFGGLLVHGSNFFGM
jgi:mono/diheme cytochrome c family protein